MTKAGGRGAPPAFFGLIPQVEPPSRRVRVPGPLRRMGCSWSCLEGALFPRRRRQPRARRRTERRAPTQRPKGEPPRRPGRGGAAPANGAPARPTGPGRSEGRASRRAAPVRGPSRPNKIKGSILLSCVTANTTKWEFCWGGVPRGPGVSASRAWSVSAPQNAPKSSEKRVFGSAPWGGTTTPPQGCFVLCAGKSHVMAVTCDAKMC